LGGGCQGQRGQLLSVFVEPRLDRVEELRWVAVVADGLLVEAFEFSSAFGEVAEEHQGGFFVAFFVSAAELRHCFFHEGVLGRFDVADLGFFLEGGVGRVIVGVVEKWAALHDGMEVRCAAVVTVVGGVVGGVVVDADDFMVVVVVDFVVVGSIVVVVRVGAGAGVGVRTGAGAGAGAGAGVFGRKEVGMGG
jgi:hypothetical protein